MRALLLLLDSPGCATGGASARLARPDWSLTLNRLFHAQPSLELPALFSLGWWKIVTGDVLAARARNTQGRWGRVLPKAAGRDLTALLWELAGVVRAEPFNSFEEVPAELLAELTSAGGTELLLPPAGSSVAQALADLGSKQVRSHKPILHVQAGLSALRLLCHVDAQPTESLQVLVRRLRRVADKWRVAEVIGHTFTGKAGQYDLDGEGQVIPLVPPRTVLNAMAEAGLSVHAVGPVARCFGNSGITVATPARADREPLAQVDAAWASMGDGLVLAAIPSAGRLMGLFDVAQHLLRFDTWLQGFLRTVEVDDLVILAAAPWQMPSAEGYEVPVSVLHRREIGPLGTRQSLADAAATLSEYFKLRQRWPVGDSFFHAPNLAQRPYVKVRALSES